MNIHGTHTLTQLDPDQVWDGLLNPSQLIKVLPYAQNLTFLAQQERAVLNLYGAFGQPELQEVRVELAFRDHQRPHQYSFQFLLLTENESGSINGEGHIYLEAAANQTDTIVQYTITGECQGLFLQTGERLIETMTRGFMRQLLTDLGSVLRQEELVTPLPITPAPPASALKPWILATAVLLIPLLLFILLWRRRHHSEK